ncbi:MAG TPA: prepilin peptidase [Gaiellaceae bacterium]|nr:prepilin peptidase [Gaiellaceae bacterium]
MALAAAGIAFFPALALGSFLNVVAARVPLRRSIARPGSACMACGTPIAWYDNVPVLSWFVLRGRCRSCDAKISWRYPAVEFATAVLIAACFWKFGLSGEAAVASFYCAVLVVLSSIDIDRRIVPNRIVLPAAVIVLAAQTAVKPSVQWVLGGLGASLFLFLAALAYPRGMGMGDVKLALLLGFMVGKTVPIALFAGMIFALVPSAVLFARHGVAARKMGIPFAPFLALGGLLALFAGKPLLDAYLSLLH